MLRLAMLSLGSLSCQLEKKKDWGLIFEEVGGEGKQLQFKRRSFYFFFPLGHKVVLGQNCLLQKDFSGWSHN